MTALLILLGLTALCFAASAPPSDDYDGEDE